MYLVNRVPWFPSQFWHLPHSSQTTALKLYAIHYRHGYNGQLVTADKNRFTQWLITFKTFFSVYDKQKLWLHRTSSDFFVRVILIWKKISVFLRIAATRVMQYNLILHSTLRNEIIVTLLWFVGDHEVMCNFPN